MNRLISVQLILFICGAGGAFAGPAADEERGSPHPRDLGRAVSAAVEDFWTITTSPVRLDRRGALTLGGFLAASGLVFACDEEILDWFDRNRDERAYEFFVEPGRRLEPVGHMGNTMKYYVGGLTVAWLARSETLLPFFAHLVESHAIAGLYKNGSNILVGRARPFEEEGPYFFKYDSGTSFPSGHASNIFQVAVILSHHGRYRPFSVAVYALAASVALERLDSNSHWPSDVFIGAAMGAAVAKAVIARSENRRARFAPSRSPISGLPGVAFSLPF